jgi:uroporphyrinogen-III synthase
MRRVLILRPEPGAGETLRRAKEQGLDAAAVPLFTVEPVAWEVPDPGSFDALLLTSANAVRHAGEGLKALRGLPAYAVGDATAEAAREAGFDIKGTGDAGVERLLGSIEADIKLLHLCGDDRKEAAEARQEVVPLVVYRATEVAAPDLSAAAGSVALVHSPRAARRLAQLVEEKAGVAIAAISAAAAEEVGQGWETVEIADQPRDEALLALAARLCKNPQGT